MYHVQVYFEGPRSAFAGKLDLSEVIHDFYAPWLWLARKSARQRLGSCGRCGYVIARDGQVIEQVPACRPYNGGA